MNTGQRDLANCWQQTRERTLVAVWRVGPASVTLVVETQTLGVTLFYSIKTVTHSSTVSTKEARSTCYSNRKRQAFIQCSPRIKILYSV